MDHRTHTSDETLPDITFKRHGLNHQRTRLFIGSEELLLSCMLVLLLYHLYVSSEHLMVSIGQTDDSIISHFCRTRTITIYRHGLSFHLAGETAVDSRSEFAFSVQKDRGDAKTPVIIQDTQRTPLVRQMGFFRFSAFPFSVLVSVPCPFAVIRNGI